MFALTYSTAAENQISNDYQSINMDLNSVFLPTFRYIFIILWGFCVAKSLVTFVGQ